MGFYYIVIVNGREYYGPFLSRQHADEWLADQRQFDREISGAVIVLRKP